jgi:protein SCO1/2
MSARDDRRWLGITMAAIGGLAIATAGGRADACDHCQPKAPPRGAPATRAEGRLARDAPPAGEAKAGYVRSERAYGVPDVTLVDDRGRTVPLRDVLAAEEPVMLNFIFTTCNAICPVMSGIFARVPQELGSDAGKVRLVSISIDPEQDTPARLRAYAERFGAAPRWTFLTGTLRDVEAVERAFDAYRGDKMNHEPLTLLRAGPGRAWVRIEGFASPAELAREYARAAGKVALR